MLVRGSLVGILPKRTFVLITTTTTTLPNVHILGRNLELAFFEEVLQNWCILRFWTTAGVFRVVSAADLSHFCNFACSGRCGIWCNSLIASFQTCGRAIYFWVLAISSFLYCAAHCNRSSEIAVPSGFPTMQTLPSCAFWIAIHCWRTAWAQFSYVTAHLYQLTTSHDHIGSQLHNIPSHHVTTDPTTYHMTTNHVASPDFTSKTSKLPHLTPEQTTWHHTTSQYYTSHHNDETERPKAAAHKKSGGRALVSAPAHIL